MSSVSLAAGHTATNSRVTEVRQRTSRIGSATSRSTWETTGKNRFRTDINCLLCNLTAWLFGESDQSVLKIWFEDQIWLVCCPNRSLQPRLTWATSLEAFYQTSHSSYFYTQKTTADDHKSHNVPWWIVFNTNLVNTTKKCWVLIPSSGFIKQRLSKTEGEWDLVCGTQSSRIIHSEKLKKKNVASFEGRNKTKKNVFCRLINVCFVPEQQQRSQHLCK